MVLTLMFREYCSLCHQMRAALQPYQAEYGFELQVFDVDADPEPEAPHNELVSVLLHGGVAVCKWHLDEAKLLAVLQNAKAT